MSIFMVLVALGIINLFDVGLSIPASLVLLMFAFFFTLSTVYFDKYRGAVYPWSLVGGAVVSICITFIVMSAIGGIIYITSGGLTALHPDTILYSISTCMIISVITLNLASYKLQYF